MSLTFILKQTQLSVERRFLLGPEPFQGSQLTFTRHCDPKIFKLKDSAGRNEALIREMLKSSKR